MSAEKGSHKASIVYFSHGGGPLPLLGDPGHAKMISFLQELSLHIKKPDAIIVFSAHWEASIPTIIGSKNPALFYDYYGFPPEAYSIDYPLPGNPELSNKIKTMFDQHAIKSNIDISRGFDHGVFIPLKIMYPDAVIPTVQISLVNGLDPLEHIALGNALEELAQENILFIGSGFSFHNLQLFSWNYMNMEDPKNNEFQDALINICTKETSYEKARNMLVDWKALPNASYCHPREEHLLPLHICFGLAKTAGTVAFDDYILGKRSVAILWQ